MQTQMSFLEVPRTVNAEAVWPTLDQRQRDAVVELLARLIAKTVGRADLVEEARDE